MAVKEHVQAAIAWLEKVASEIEQGVEHDYDKIAEKVHGYLHYGPTLGKAPAPEAVVPAETKAADGETNTAEGGTKPAEGETKPAEGETKPAEGETKAADTGTASAGS